MSLEQAIADLTKAIKENTDTLLSSMEQRKAVMDKLPGAASKKPAEVKTEKVKDEKAEKPKKSTKEITDGEIRKAFGAFLADEDLDDDQVDERKDFVEALCAEFGVKKAVEIPQENREQALEWLAQKAKGKKVSFNDDEEPAAKSRKPAVDEDDEDDRPAKKKRSRDDDEDERPAKKRRVVEDDDEEEDEE